MSARNAPPSPASQPDTAPYEATDDGDSDYLDDHANPKLHRIQLDSSTELSGEGDVLSNDEDMPLGQSTA